MEVLAFINKKGGAGKTTNVVGVAFGLNRLGYRVAVVDTDPNGSASRWLADIDSIDVAACAPADLAALVGGLQGDYDYIVVDTPPNDVQSIAEVAAAADHVYVPLAPSGIEFDQLADTADLVEAAGTPWTVIPCRVRMSTKSGQTIVELFKNNSISVTSSLVTMSEAINQSFGAAPPPIAFAALTAEIVEQNQVTR